MIDCHVHAVPAPTEYLQQRLQRHAPIVAAWLGKRSGKHGSHQTASTRAASNTFLSPLDIERVVWMRRHLPRGLNQAIEHVLSLVGAPVLSWTGTLPQLLQSMDQNHIEQAILIAAPEASSNAWVLDLAYAQQPKRLIPVCGLPDIPQPASIASWEQAWQQLAQRGAQGFKIHPNMDGLSATQPAYRALFQVASQYNRFVVLHTGAFSAFQYRNQQPADPRAFAPLFAEYPHVRVCLAHMNRDEPEVVWQLMRRHEHLYCDTSWQPADNVRRAINEVGIDRILLGSDWPLLHPGLQKNALDIVHKAADSTSFEKMTKRNPMRFIHEC